MLYLDTSVLVAYYCPEALSRQVQSLLREQVKPALSVLTEVEFTSAVAKKIRLNELGNADANRILAKFTSHVEAGLYRMVPVENHHWRLARGWIGLFTTSLRTLDALHLAIASAEELQLITSDKQFYQAAEMFAVDARLVAP
ncbi:MAG: type II toxin-antitoxin system VapC family toxin [Deltaproteobacteria bacterium]|nr:type II toxin-antitoxin system VapC family toxin [Deltaproteobacteria bacterium]